MAISYLIHAKASRPDESYDARYTNEPQDVKARSNNSNELSQPLTIGDTQTRDHPPRAVVL